MHIYVFTQLFGYVFAHYSTVYVGTTRADAESRDDSCGLCLYMYVYSSMSICICSFTQLCMYVGTTRADAESRDD